MVSYYNYMDILMQTYNSLFENTEHCKYEVRRLYITLKA